MTDEKFEKAIDCCIKGECAYCPNGINNASGEIVCRQRLLALMPDYIKRHKAEKEQIRKETAKEILQVVSSLDDTYKCRKWFMDLEKKYGVEVTQ